MYLCAYTLNYGNDHLEDIFLTFETRAEAGRFVEEKLYPLDHLHCWAVAEITAASEPQWLEDVA